MQDGDYIPDVVDNSSFVKEIKWHCSVEYQESVTFIESIATYFRNVLVPYPRQLITDGAISQDSFFINLSCNRTYFITPAEANIVDRTYLRSMFCF